MNFEPQQKQPENKLKFVQQARPIVSCLMSAYAIALIVVGAIYLHDCPINRLIPIWMVVSGASALIIVLSVFLDLLLSYLIIKNKDPTRSARMAKVRSLLAIYAFVASLFNFAWFIAGNVWVYSAYKSVVYDDMSSPMYCYRSMYLFAFWTITLVYIIIGLLILIGIAVVILTILKTGTFVFSKVGELWNKNN